MSVIAPADEDFLDAVKTIVLDIKTLMPVEGQKHLRQRLLGSERDKEAKEVVGQFKQRQACNSTIPSR